MKSFTHTGVSGGKLAKRKEKAAVIAPNKVIKEADTLFPFSLKLIHPHQWS